MTPIEALLNLECLKNSKILIQRIIQKFEINYNIPQYVLILEYII